MVLADGEMCLGDASIIQRAGIVPLSIAGIFKEVTTITVSAWVFGDQLTPINDIGVVITVGGTCLGIGIVIFFVLFSHCKIRLIAIGVVFI